MDHETHRSIMLKILKDIYSDPSIGANLGFKGGTAAMLFYDLDRFSVDLDFDLLDPKKEDRIFSEIKKILEKYGTVKEATKKRFNLFFFLSDKEKKPKDRNVKIEIKRKPLGSKYDIRSFYGIPMQVMTRRDMSANKLCALYDRIGRTNRDIYDVYFFLQNDWPINRELVASRTNMKYSEFIEKLIKKVDRFDDADILAGMGELLTEKQKVWVKSKLKQEVLFLLKLELDNN